MTTPESKRLAFQERTNLPVAITSHLERKAVVNMKEVSTRDGDLYRAGVSPVNNRTVPSSPATASTSQSHAVKHPISANHRDDSLDLTAADMTTVQIDLLERAIAIIKDHASEAATNVARLRTLLSAEKDTDSTRYKALQRERWLEERREQDATTTLWRACQHAEAIVTRDQLFFDEERRKQERRQRWYERQVEEERGEYGFSVVSELQEQGIFYPLTKQRAACPTLSLEAGPSISPVAISVHRHARLLPLTLASKADPAAFQAKPHRASFTSSTSSRSSASSELRTPVTFIHNIHPTPHEEPNVSETSGTVTIFRTTATDDRASAVMEDERENAERSKSFTNVDIVKKLAEDLPDVKMPDYVEDLLTEFDSQAPVPTLSLLSLPKSEADDHVSPLHIAPSNAAFPKSAPSSPAKPRRTLHKSPSTRFSGFFAKRQRSLSSLHSQSPYNLNSTQIPSRLGSSIDLVIHEERAFSLEMDLGLENRNHSNISRLTPSGLNPKRFSESAAGSMVSLLSGHGTRSEQSHEDANSVPLPTSASATSFTHAQDDAEDDTMSPPVSAVTIGTTAPPEDKKFTSRLKKRISALRF